MTPEQFVDHLETTSDRFVSFFASVMRDELAQGEKRLKSSFKPYPSAKRLFGELNERSGSLKDALGASFPVIQGDKVSGSIGLQKQDERSVMVAEVQEYGATIRPRNAEKLAIPWAEGLNADGTRRFETIFHAWYEYDYVKFTEDMIYGVDDGFMELIALRRDVVRIDDTGFIQDAAARTIDEIEDRLYDDPDLDKVF